MRYNVVSSFGYRVNERNRIFFCVNLKNDERLKFDRDTHAYVEKENNSKLQRKKKTKIHYGSTQFLFHWNSLSNGYEPVKCSSQLDLT